MMVDQSVFSRTSRIFENARLSSLTRHEIEFPSAAQVMQTSSRLFQMLDRTDPAQAEISRRLWVLRSSILFTILPFDDSALRLQQQMNELEQFSGCLPDAAQLVESLRTHVTDIVSVGRNPKREWLLHMLLESIGKDDRQIGILGALSAGSPPGWPPERSGYLSELSDRIMLIGSRRNLRSSVFETVILPCACNNVPSSLLSDLLFSGVAARFEVLLYPGERFHIPKRLILPSDDIFVGRMQKSEIEREVVVVPGDPALSAVDTWINEAFWQGLHGAARSSSPDLFPAKYMLFCDGTGAFLPESGHVLMLPVDGKVTDESDLCLVRVQDVCEGDLVVLRSGDSGYLLDEASERIMGRAGNEDLFEKATDWKESLEALLVTHSNEEVAQALRERGAPTSAASIQQWIGPDVLGPGNERVFRELISLLADKGKIRKEGVELISYADSRWKSLQDLRGVRHKAGNLIRQDLFKALFSRFGNGNVKLADRESVHIQGHMGAELLVLRVSSVDRNTAHVHASRLGQMDDLKGNKWLG
jgi:hypothetical protein